MHGGDIQSVSMALSTVELSPIPEREVCDGDVSVSDEDFGPCALSVQLSPPKWEVASEPSIGDSESAPGFLSSHILAV